MRRKKRALITVAQHFICARTHVIPACRSLPEAPIHITLASCIPSGTCSAELGRCAASLQNRPRVAASRNFLSSSPNATTGRAA